MIRGIRPVTSMTYFALVTIFVFSWLAQGQVCADVDLRDKFPPIWNQVNDPNCYAYSAADVAAYHFGEPVSVPWIVLNYNQAWFQIFMSPLTPYHRRIGGSPLAALNEVGKVGFCRDRDMPTDLGDQSPMEAFAKVRSLANKFARLVFASADEKLSLVKSEPALKKLFPRLSDQEIISTLATESPHDALNALANKACVNRLNFPPSTSFGDDVIPILQDMLGRKRIRQKEVMEGVLKQIAERHPVSLGINLDVLFTADPIDSKEADHAILLIGSRRMKDGQCQILVRNSWGQNCNSYDSSFDCDPATGYFWISADHLATGTHRAHWMK